MAKQVIIEKIQTWLNQTYENSAGYNTIAVTGTPGWDTTNAMLIAYQIEDGVSTGIINNETSSGIYDFAGENFTPISSGTDFSTQSNKNRLMILQGAFYVMGINPGSFGGAYSSSFESAVSTLQSNAGIAATGIADLLVVKALLSMDSFTVLSQYGGVEAIAQIQRALNAEYAQDMGGLIPCDGVYGRDLNKALIYALQIQEGISVADANEADGYFGHGTQADCPTLVPNDTSEFVTILQYALYCNGYTGVSFTGTYDAATQAAVNKFGRNMGISTQYGTQAGLDIWMGLLLSSGNPNKVVSGCDAAQTLTLEDAQTLKSNGYDIVGRYLTGIFATTVDELTNILNAGLNVFPIYETGSYQTSYFSAGQGTSDAQAAVQACRELGIPEGTTIYFTVDYDMEEPQIQSLVLPYFEAIKNKFNDAQLNYNIGVYGSRNVCQQTMTAGYAEFAFVDGASTGYSGNMGYPMPVGWAFNQIKEGVTLDGIQIDNDQVSGLDSGFGSINPIGGSSVSNINGISTINQLPDTGSSSSNQKFINDIEGFASFVTQQLLNIKITTEENKAWNSKWFTKPYMFADDNAYIRFDEGYKPQFLNGGMINAYWDGGVISFDTLNNGIGANHMPEEAFKDGSTFMDKVKTIIPTGTGFKGYVQFYPYWRSEDGHTLPGYYECGAELGVTINEELIKTYLEFIKGGEDNTTLVDELMSVVGMYMYVDVIIGIKKDIFDTIGGMFSCGVYEFSMLIATIIQNLKLGELSLNTIDSAISAVSEAGTELIESFTGGIEALVGFIDALSPVELLIGALFAL